MGLMAALAELEPDWSGPWHEHQVHELPARPGLYCVCECAAADDPSGWRLLRPLYIGESANVREAVISSGRWDRWRALLRPGHGLCFGYLSAAPARLALMEGAMIAYYRPPGNLETARA